MLHGCSTCDNPDPNLNMRIGANWESDNKVPKRFWQRLKLIYDTRA